jgi:hypothetical protein
MANAGNFQGTNASNNYFVKNRNFPLTGYIALDKYRQNKLSGCCIEKIIENIPPSILEIFIGVPGAPVIDDIVYDGPTVPEIIGVIVF